MMNGYYWAWTRERPGEVFVTLHENGAWYCPGIEEPIDVADDEIIGSIPLPVETITIPADSTSVH